MWITLKNNRGQQATFNSNQIVALMENAGATTLVITTGQDEGRRFSFIADEPRAQIVARMQGPN